MEKSVTRLKCKRKGCEYSWDYAPNLSKRKKLPELPRRYTSCPICKSQVRIPDGEKC